MSESTFSESPSSDDRPAEQAAISIVQRGNLKSLEQTLRKQWRLGQSIVLCWSADKRGLLVIFVPRYFLGNYCATGGAREDSASENEGFIRELISGARRKPRDELFDIADRLGVAPTFIKLNEALSEESNVEQASQLNSLSYSLNSAYSKLLAQGVEVNFARTTTGDGYYVWNRNLSAYADQDGLPHGKPL